MIKIKTSLHLIKNRYLGTFLYFYSRLKYRIFIRMGLSISIGIFDGFGLAMFLPLLNLADSSSQENVDGLGNLNFLVEGMRYLNLDLNLRNILLLILTFFIIKGIINYISIIYEVYLKQFFIKTIRINLTSSLSTMSYKSFIMADPGRIQNTLSGEVGRISKAFENYFGAFKQVVLIIVYMVFAFLIDAQFALLICAGGLITNFLYIKIYKLTKISSLKLTKGSNYYQGLIIQMVSNFKYLKATGYLKTYTTKLLDSIEYIENHNKKIGNLGAIVSSIREPILIIVVCIVILIQIELLDGTFGTIMISLLFFYRALSSMIYLQSYYNEYLAVSGSMENMTEFENELKNSQEQQGTTELLEFENKIELKQAEFQYSDQKIIKSIDLSITKNSTIAFVGDSGGGKTTLVNLLTGLMPLNSGKLLIDNIDSKSINLDSFQKRIGYITQEPVIFNETIFNNITLWADPTEENLKRFESATKQAYIYAYINQLPKKEQTKLGINGVNLSGGQKQRIAIARELFKQIDILIFDEATSALDSETEGIIQKGIERLYGKYTIIIIAHRLSSIKHADRIIVLSNGKIIDDGSFTDLVENSPVFKKMVELQEV